MKTETISFKVTKEEKELITQAAKSSGLSISNYVVKAVKEKTLNRKMPTDLPKNICEIINSISELTSFNNSSIKNNFKKSIYELEDHFVDMYNNIGKERNDI